MYIPETDLNGAIFKQYMLVATKAARVLPLEMLLSSLQNSVIILTTYELTSGVFFQQCYVTYMYYEMQLSIAFYVGSYN